MKHDVLRKRFSLRTLFRAMAILALIPITAMSDDIPPPIPPDDPPPTPGYGSGIAILGSITTGAAIKDGDVWVWGFRNAGISGLNTPTHAYNDLN